MHPSDTEQAVDGKELPSRDPADLHPARVRQLRPSAAGPLPIDPDLDADESETQKPSGRSSRRDGIMPHRRVLAVVALGGFAGGLTRYELGLAFPGHHGAFPATTFAINVSGSFILALLVVFVLEVWPPTTYVRPLVGVGFCGAYTTFSTWMVGIDQLVSDGKPATAAWYLVGSLLAGLAATSLGLTGGRAVVAHRRRVLETGGGR